MKFSCKPGARVLFKTKKKRRQEKDFSLDFFIFLKHSYSSAALFNRVLINAIIIIIITETSRWFIVDPGPL